MIAQINMTSIFLSILLLFVIFLHVAQMRPAKEQLAFLLMQVFLFIFLIILSYMTHPPHFALFLAIF